MEHLPDICYYLLMRPRVMLGIAAISATCGTLPIVASSSPVSSSSLDRDALDQIATVSGTNSDSSRAIDIDDAGNRYVVGSFSGTTTFSSATNTGASSAVDNNSVQETTAPGSAVFLAKYAPTGSLLWVATARASSWIYGYAVAVDGTGNVVITGRFLATATFTSARGAATGNLINQATASVTALSPDNSGTANGEMFIAHFTSAGALSWVTTASNGTQYNEANSVALDANGNVYVTGHIWTYDLNLVAQFRSAVSAASGSRVDTKTLSLPINYWLDIFVAKYSATGSLQWVAIAGSSAEDRSFGISVGSDGHPVIAGSHAGDLSVSSARMPTTGNPTPDTGTKVSTRSITLTSQSYDCVVAKYHSDGTVMWASRLGAAGTDWCEGVDVGPNNKVRLVGHFTNPFSVTSATVASTGAPASSDQIAVSSRGGTDLMAVSYTANGTLEWVATGGAATNENAWSAASAPNGDLLLSARVNGSPTLTSAKAAVSNSPVDDNTLTVAHQRVNGSLVARFSAEGNLLWLTTAQATTEVSITDVAVDSDNRVHGTGYYAGDLTLVAGDTSVTSTSSGTDALWIRWGRLPPPASTPTESSIVPPQTGDATGATVTTTTSAPSTTSPPVTPSVAQPSSARQRVKPGEGIASIDGVRTPVKVFVERNTDLVAQGENFELRVSGDCAGKCPIATVGSRQVLVLERTGAATVSGYGFRPGSRVYVWLFSEPRLLGQFTVNEDGTFSGTVQLEGVAEGQHTLTANGTSSDGRERSTNLGVVVGALTDRLPSSGTGLHLFIWAMLCVVMGRQIRWVARQFQ